MAQATVKGRAVGAGTGDPTDLSANQTSTILDGATDPFLRSSAAGSSGITQLTSDVTAGPGSGSQVATIANDAVTNAKAANMSQSTIKGRAAGASTGDPTDLTANQTSTVLDGATDPFLRTSAASAAGITQLTGDVTAGPGSGSQATTIANNAVTDAKLRDSAALSVIGRSANSSGDPADIAAASDGQTIRRSGTSIGFGALDLASANAITGDLPFANLTQASAANLLLGRGSASGAGDYQEVSLGTNLSMSGTTLSASGVVSGSGGLVGVQVITTTGAGTYTPTTGTAIVVIELQGAGGAGGGSAGSPSNGAAGAGGGAGGWVRVKLTTAFSGAAYTVGAKGTGGSNANGTTGGDTVFTATGGGGTVYTASGGIGGNAGGAATAVNVGVVTAGGPSSSGIYAGVNNVIGGKGGDSMYGRAAQCVRFNAANSTVSGNAGTGKGSGGGGGASVGTGAATLGGDGTDGVIVIWEFS
jgi:hypothetical protein